MSQSSIVEMARLGKELPLSGAALTELLKSVLAKGRSFRFRAMGTSMYPFIRDGDVIVVSPLRQDQPRLGDVVACLRPNSDRLIVHRVLQKQTDLYLVKGDNAPDDDGWLPGESILGRVVRIERKGRAVHFGLGIERLLIVALARIDWLVPVVHCGAWRVVLPVARRMRS